MSNVYLDSHFNSTMFTTCCDVAINEAEKHCPRCRVEMSLNGHKHRWLYAYNRAKRIGYGRYGSYRYPTSASGGTK